MADLKISQLTGATTPVAGTEVLPIVQSSSTKKVSIANLTAGRAVSFLSASTTAGNDTTSFLSNGATTGWQNWVVSNTSGKIYLGVEGSTAGTFCVGDTAYDAVIVGKSGISFSGNDGNATHLRIASTGDTTFKGANLVQGTAAKGVNFTANTPAAGMTSQLLNWYEEGTWTPNQGAGLTVVGAFSSSGTYTRIGRQVFIQGSVSGATSIAAASAGNISTNLPYSAGADATGTAIDAANNASSILKVSSATLTAATAIATTATITFSAVYSV